MKTCLITFFQALIFTTSVVYITAMINVARFQAYGKWPDKWKKWHIFVLEFYPMVLGVHLWSAQLKNKRKLFYSDNENVVHVINKQTFKDKCMICTLAYLTYTLELGMFRGNRISQMIVSLAYRSKGSIPQREEWITFPKLSPLSYNQTTGRYFNQTLRSASSLVWRIFQQFEINVLGRPTPLSRSARCIGSVYRLSSGYLLQRGYISYLYICVRLCPLLGLFAKPNQIRFDKECS